MRRGHNQTERHERTRYLNIVYFVESARSHTIRINLTYARWAIGALAVIVLWSFGSIFWIANLEYQVAKTRLRLETALATIFDNQIKNEKVFEEAYPNEATKAYYSELAQLPSNNPISDTPTSPDAQVKSPQNAINTKTPSAETLRVHDDTKNATSATPVLPEKNKPLANDGSTSPSDLKTLDGVSTSPTYAAEATANSPSFDITGAKLSKTDSRILLNFSMRNKNIHRGEGFIWAVARLAHENGETRFVGSPEYTKLDTKTGNLTSGRSGYKFSILKFKNKELDFKTPSSTQWKLTKLTVFYTDLQGKNEQKIDIPVEKLAVTNHSTMPPTDITF